MRFVCGLPICLIYKDRKQAAVVEVWLLHGRLVAILFGHRGNRFGTLLLF